MDTTCSDGRCTALQCRLVATFEGDNKDVFTWTLVGFGL